jgi:hypothetical protein
MSDDGKNARTLDEILNGGNPRTHEYQSLFKKIRRGRRGEALKFIQEIYSCEPNEAAVVFDEMKAHALGSQVDFQEIELSGMSNQPGDRSSNPLSIPRRYMGRSGTVIGELVPGQDGIFFLNGVGKLRSEIDQVWAVVSRSEAV